ncbi:hypothetical protein V8E54_006359 [Elaphomyces granulatus]
MGIYLRCDWKLANMAQREYSAGGPHPSTEVASSSVAKTYLNVSRRLSRKARIEAPTVLVRVIISPSLTAGIFVDAARHGSGGIENIEKQGEIRGVERRNDAIWDAAGNCRIVGLLRSVFTLALPEKSTNDRPLSLLGLSILAGD